MQKALGPRSKKKKKIKNHMMNKTAKHSYKLFHLFQEFAFLKSNTAILPNPLRIKTNRGGRGS